VKVKNSAAGEKVYVGDTGSAGESNCAGSILLGGLLCWCASLGKSCLSSWETDSRGVPLGGQFVHRNPW